MLRILKGFGMRLLAFDPYPSAAALESVPITPAVLPYMVKPVRPSREKLASRVRW
jgi:phosphoglycerate dehydrogenase-like enzyme